MADLSGIEERLLLVKPNTRPALDHIATVKWEARMSESAVRRSAPGTSRTCPSARRSWI